MQYAIHRPNHPKLTALAAAIAMGGAGGVAIAAIVDDGGGVQADARPAPTSVAPTGGDTPTPFGGTRAGRSEPTGANRPQAIGGARP